MTDITPRHGAFRHIPFMGVIYVVAEAMKLGFENGHPDWCNLGQGQPEVGEMEGAPERYSHLDFEPLDHAYGHVGGTDELCDMIAAHYNRLYRVGKQSQYTRANVSVAAGGRLMLTRAFAALGKVNLGYQVPDYTAYEDMIDYSTSRITPVMLPTTAETGFAITPEQVDTAITDEGLGALLVSNPCNPTGVVIQGDELKRLVDIGRARDCTLLLDEFYSHFIYTPEGGPADGPVSAAAYVEDVESDPVILIDGLTKNYRYPGWRVGWAIGPSEMIDSLDRAASAIDGGPGRPIQRAAMAVLEPGRADQETDALREVFSRKRNLMVSRLRDMGIRCARESEATFYTWASIADLPAPLNDGDAFFRAALQHKVMTVPGVYFDVNPGKERLGESPFRQWVRFSFGPPEDNVAMGLDRLERMVDAAR